MSDGRLAQSARAAALQAAGRGFEPLSDHFLSFPLSGDASPLLGGGRSVNLGPLILWVDA